MKKTSSLGRRLRLVDRLAALTRHGGHYIMNVGRHPASACADLPERWLFALETLPSATTLAEAQAIAQADYETR